MSPKKHLNMEPGCESRAAGGSRRRSESELNNSLRESCRAKAIIRRENTNSRRYSASFMRSFGEETRSSFRTISSTSSSPGYYSLTRSGEIDPSTYSFTTALQALQARSAYNSSWECLSPEGFALNSKWNEAEKYICNPLSGEFPKECLSAKTLSSRSYNFPNRITMSAPLIYSSHRRCPFNVAQEETRHHFPYQETRVVEGTSKRDVGTQSTPPAEELSWSSSLSPAASTPSIIERSLNRCGPEPGDSPISTPKLITSQHQVKVIETKEDSEEEEEGNASVRVDEEQKTKDNKKDDHKKQFRRRGINGGGCLPWMRKRPRHNNNNNNNNNNNKRRPRKTYFPSLKGC